METNKTLDMEAPSRAQLNTWVELEMILDNLCSHQYNKRRAFKKIADLIERSDKIDVKEYQTWKNNIGSENETKRKLKFWEMDITSIMNRLYQ